MGSQVEASTIQAGQLFSTTTFTVPDFQRSYSWDVATEVTQFWDDLVANIDSPPYFLGLLIVTDESGSKTVVDGQQRLITLTLLANAVRKAARRRSRNLVADSMRDVFLVALNYETEARSSRLKLTADRDRIALEACLGDEPLDTMQESVNNNIIRAQRFLSASLDRDLANHDASTRLGRWARFISNGLTFALFEHPDRNAAYKVYEVVNTRGKDLTPAELIKSYLFAESDRDLHAQVYERWNAVELAISDVDKTSSLTQFIRHTVILSHGYVLPRDLYQEISKEYKGDSGVEQFLSELEGQLPLYLQMLDPSLDADSEESVLKAFQILEALGLSTVRPIFMATIQAEAGLQGFEAMMKLMIARVATGSFGTGNIERRFADAARDIWTTRDWRRVIARLDDLQPPAEDLKQRLENRPYSRAVATVLRCAILQGTSLPSIDGYLHYVRPKSVEYWPGFDDEEFKVVGTTLGNCIISRAERRPRGTNNPEAVEERLLTTAVDFEEVVPAEVHRWTADSVRQWNRLLAQRGVEVLHGA